MRIEERLRLAYLAYQRAVVRARRETTPASWRQLRTAGTNLRCARRDQDRLRPPTGRFMSRGRGRSVGRGARTPAGGVVVLLRPVRGGRANVDPGRGPFRR